jgi:hypothetical protein
MRIDLYTKSLLTLIVVFLGFAVLRPMLEPSPVQAVGKFDGVVFSASPAGFWAFDTRTGDAWEYGGHAGPPMLHIKMVQLGAPTE